MSSASMDTKVHEVLDRINRILSKNTNSMSKTVPIKKFASSRIN